MPPKKATMSSVYIVTNNSGIEGAYASNKAAEARAGDFKNGKVVEQALVGGSIAVAAEEKSAKPTKKSKAIKNEDEDEEEDENDGAPAKKTKPPEEQRAANAKKPAKAGDDDLPDNVKALLKGSGTIFEGMSVVVTGVPPMLGRTNADKLVQIYGGKLVKAIAKKTSFVVLGNDAGPKKLDQIKEFGLKSYTDTEFIKLIEGRLGAGGPKRSVDDDDDDDEEDEKPVKKPAKKQKK